MKTGSISNELSDYIIYEDANIVAINKPEGLLAIPDGYDKSLPNLRDILGNVYGKIWTVHRLDKDTSGVILFAKSADVHRLLNQSFTQRNVLKRPTSA